MARFLLQAAGTLMCVCMFGHFWNVNACTFTCRNCINCLYELQKPNESTQMLGIPDGKCLQIDRGTYPRKCSTEYSFLQQIMYMYRDEIVHTLQGIPCLDGCLNCVEQAKHYDIERLEKNYLESLYDGIFFSNADDYTHTKTDITDDVSDNKGYVSGHIRKRHLVPGCGTSKTTKPFLKTLTDNGGKLWYPVWFNAHSPNYQYYEKINCGSGSGCSLKKTIQSFLVTTWLPHGAYGHSFTLFNNIWLSNIKIKNVGVGGYCDR